MIDLEDQKYKLIHQNLETTSAESSISLSEDVLREGIKEII